MRAPHATTTLHFYRAVDGTPSKIRSRIFLYVIDVPAGNFPRFELVGFEERVFPKRPAEFMALLWEDPRLLQSFEHWWPGSQKAVVDSAIRCNAANAALDPVVTFLKDDPFDPKSESYPLSTTDCWHASTPQLHISSFIISTFIKIRHTTKGVLTI
jgi:hypothetical protein